jgi:cytochrome P450
MAIAHPLVPPGPKGEPIIGNARAFVLEPLEYLRRCAHDYGDVMQIRLGTTAIYMVSSPELIEQVLVTNNKKYRKSRFTQRRKNLFGNGLIFSEGDFWLRQRRLMQPAFHQKRIASYGEAMVAQSQRIAANWQDGQELTMQEEMMQLSLEIVTKTLFDSETTGDIHRIGKALDILIEQVSAAAVRPIQYPDWVPTSGNRQYNAALAELNVIIRQIISEHRQRTSEGDDLLSTLLQMQDEDGSRMTDKQLRDEVVNLYIAGHETVAMALSYAWRLLANHPEAEEKLAAELETVLHGRAPTIEDLPLLPYTEQVVNEALRLYPPVWGVFRDCQEADELGGYAIKPGTVILLSTWVVHHDERFYAEPEEFRPERWEKQAVQQRPRYAYFPFGGGQRLCIGNIFAMVEARLILATLAQKWRFTLVPDQPFELVPAITIRPKYGIQVVSHSRSHPV